MRSLTASTFPTQGIFQTLRNLSGTHLSQLISVPNTDLHPLQGLLNRLLSNEVIASGEMKTIPACNPSAEGRRKRIPGSCWLLFQVQREILSQGSKVESDKTPMVTPHVTRFPSGGNSDLKVIRAQTCPLCLHL